jgi:hypothetical protein
MIGNKKDKHTSFLGQKYNTAHSSIGNKFSYGQNNYPSNFVSHADVRDNENMEANHPIGLKIKKDVSKKSYLEKK